MLLAVLPLQLFKQIQLVHLHVDKVSLGLVHTLHQSRLRHIRVYYLDNQPLGTHQFVFVGTFLHAVLFPLSLAPQVLLIAPPNVGHDTLHGLVYATLTATCTCHQAVHQRGLMLCVIGIGEPHATEMCSQWRKYRMSHCRLIHHRRLRCQQLYQFWQFLRHLRRY